MTEIEQAKTSGADPAVPGTISGSAGGVTELEALASIAPVLSTELDLRSLLQKATEVATRAIDAAMGAFFYDEQPGAGGPSPLCAHSGASPSVFRALGGPGGNPLVAPFFRADGPVRIDDLASDPRHAGARARGPGAESSEPVRSYLSVPVATRAGEPLGGLFFGHPQPGRFDERAERLAVAIAAQAALAIENARLYARARREIAKRAHAEAALDESRLRLQLTLEAGRMGVWEWDIRTGAVTGSASLSRLHGRAPGAFEATLESALADVHPEDRERVRGALRAVIDSGAEHQVEYRVIAPEGQERWLEARGSLFRGPDGAPQKMVGVCTDITARKLAEQALRESELRFSRFMEHLPGLAWIKDAQGRYLFANEATERAIGAPRASVLGKTDQELAMVQGGVGISDGDRRALERGGKTEAVETRVDEEGVHYSIVTRFPIPGGNGGPAMIGGMAIDITDRVKAEEARAHLAAIVESSDDAIISKTLDGVITSWNAGAERIYGYTAAEAVGRPVMMLIPPDRCAEEAQILARLNRGERIEHFETVRRTKNGRLIDVSLTVSPVRDPSGRVIGASKIARDVTGAKRAEAALRASERRYRQLVEGLPAAVYTCDAEGRITLFNEAAEELWGRPPRIGVDGWHSFWKMFRPDGRPLPLEESPIARVLRGCAIAGGEEFIVERPDGSRRHVLPHPQPILDESGVQHGAVNMLVDITPIREAERALARSEARFHSLALNAPVAVFIKDLDGRYTVANPIACAALGTETVVGLTDHDLLPRELADEVRRNDLEVVATGQTIEREQRIGPDAEGKEYLSVTFPLRGGDGRIEGVCGVALDVTERTRSERALRESQERLALTADAADLGAWDYDLVARTGSWDDRCRRHFGASGRTSISYDLVLRAIHPDDFERVQEASARALDPGGNGSYRVEYRTIGIDDGVERWIRATGQAFFENDAPVRFIGATQDITERRRAEDALRESEERFRALADNISQLAWMTDAQGRVLWYNRRWFDFTGTTLEEVRGWGWTKVHHPEHVERVVRKIRACFEAGETWEDTFPLRGRDGRYRWFLSRAVPIRDASGRILRWFGTNTDITELREADAALRESEARFRAMADSAPVLIWLADTDRRCTWFNRPWLDFTGRTMEQQLGEGWMAAIHAADVDRCLRTFSEASDRRREFRTEYRLRRHDGEYRWMLDHGVPLFGPTGRFAGYVGSCIDITDMVAARTALEHQQARLEEAVRLRTEQLEESHRRLRISERMASIGTLSAGLGHDMANILLPIRLRLDAIEPLVSRDELRAELREIRSSIEYLQNLSSGLRMLVVDPSERTSGDATELQGWWRKASTVLKTAVPPGITLRSDLPETETWVHLAPTALTQSVFNLVQNAIDALRRSEGGLVEIAAIVRADAVMLSVRDNGPGMPPEVRERCTQPFFTTKTRGMSTGLGLALVYGMVKEAGGALEIESAPGQGTTVTLVLRPAAAPSSDAPRPEHTAVVEVRDARIGAIIRAELQDLGFKVSRAPTSRAPSLRVTDVPHPAQREGCLTLAIETEQLSGPGASGANVTALRRRVREAAARVFAGEAGGPGNTPESHEQDPRPEAQPAPEPGDVRAP